MTSARYDLFLAHATSDAATADALYDLLPDLRVFVDRRSLQPGERFDVAIPAAQAVSRATVVLLSAAATRGAWYTGDEIKAAIALHRAAPEHHRLLPVLLEPDAPVPYGLGIVQALDATSLGGLPGVAARLRQLLGVAPPSIATDAPLHLTLIAYVVPATKPSRRAEGDPLSALASPDLEVWRRRYPHVALVSAPAGDLDPRTWPQLTELPSQSTSGWLAGATLAELTAKLEAVDPALIGWDGTVLTGDAVVAMRLKPEQESPAHVPHSDPLHDAAWAAYREARRGGHERGVVIEGSPGSGKSLLSSIIARRFAQGALSALGYAVRRGARELAADLAATPTRSWSAVLAIREPSRRSLYATLETLRRLVPIVDGLDEILPDQLQAIADWLRKGDGWWIGTSRPLRVPGLPPSRKLHLQDLWADDARKLLVALGRPDLAEVVAGTHGLSVATQTVRDLTRTPLHTALLAQVAPRGSGLAVLDPHRLYEQAFTVLLELACRAGRISTEAAGLVQRLLSTLVGKLAIAWLRAPEGWLDRGAIDAAFDAVEMSPLDQTRVLQALEFGHLLVSLGARWEFSHRTIAEWAAAAALRRDVERTLRGGDALTRRQRAEAEQAALAPFLEDDVLPQSGRWAQLLRFYAPFLKEPLAFLDRLLGPAHVTIWRRARLFRSHSLEVASSSEILDAWSYAFEILRSCTWTRPADARIAWSIAVRRWLLDGDGPDATAEEHQAIGAFAAAVAGHLPRSLDELIRLAAHTDDQLALLRAAPLRLLPALPATHASALVRMLDTGAPTDQRAILAWHARHGVAPARTVTLRLTDVGPTDGMPRDERAVHAQLEAAAWEALLTHGHEPPWDVVRRAFAAWPTHLAPHLIRWFASASRPPGGDQGRRRGLLAALVERAISEDRSINELFDRITTDEEKAQMAARVRTRLDDPEEQSLRLLVLGIADRYERDQRRYEPSPIASEAAAVAVCEHLKGIAIARTRASMLVAALDVSGLEETVGAIWESVGVDIATRRELLLALDGLDLVPRQVPAAAVIRHRGVNSRSLHRIRWTATHVEELERDARSGRGADRHNAICALAAVANQDALTALVARLPSDDDVFTALVYDQLNTNARWWEERSVIPPGLDPARLPLRRRAMDDVPGWREDLLERLAGDDNDDLSTLLELAMRHHVHEAVPALMRRLDTPPRTDDWPSVLLVRAIDALATDEDAVACRVALRHALRLGWLGDVRLARFLRIDDLDFLMRGSALEHPSLAAAIKALGPNARRKLVALHDAVVREVSDLERGETTADAAEMLGWHERMRARSRRDALAAAIVASLDPSMALSDVVDTLAMIALEDEHHVRPAVTGLVATALAALEESVVRHPTDWPQLRRLLTHPIARMRNRAFELCADHGERGQLAGLVVEVLAGANLTVASDLVEVVGKRLSRADRDVIEALLAHPRPALRKHGARWASEVGTETWDQLLAPILEDGDPDVVGAALHALATLTPGKLDEHLRNLDGSRWTAAHDVALFNGLLSGKPRRHVAEVERGPLAWQVSESTLLQLLRQTVERRADVPDGGPRWIHASCFAGYPSLVEQVIAAAALDDRPFMPALLDGWSRASAQPVRAVARRGLARRGSLDVPSLSALLNDPSPTERLSAAECVASLGIEHLCEPAVRVLRAAFTGRPTADDYRALAIQPPDESQRNTWRLLDERIGDLSVRRARVLQTLRDAPVTFVGLVAIVARDLPFDGEEGILEAEGVAIVHIVERAMLRWGAEGAIAVLALLDRGEVEDDPTFTSLIEHAAVQHTSVRAAVEDAAAGGGRISDRILTQLEASDFDRDREGLARRLMENVFPANWEEILRS